MARIQRPVIVVPGITASTLTDEYPVEPQMLWTALLNREYERLSLHPDDLRYEAVEPALVRVGRAFGLIYDDLVKALRHELTARADRPTPVFLFPYDWRQDLAETGAQFARFVDEVVDRTCLLRHYRGYEDDPKVDLVGHSMGGLVICEYLQQTGKAARAGKVATLGTPYLGSIEALAKLLTGMGYLAGAIPKEREREAARSMVTIYQLLPSYEGALLPIGDPPPPADLFGTDAWQPGVLGSLSEYIRLHAVEPGTQAQREARAAALLADFLERAKSHRKRITELHLAKSGLRSEDWLAVVGIGARTRVHVEVQWESRQRHGKRWPRYCVGERHFVDAWGAGDPFSRDTGDSTVPLAGAIPPFLHEENLVAVTPGDFGFWELRDRTLDGATGFHAMLPNLNLNHRLVIRHFRPEFRGDVWGRPIPGVETTKWAPPIAGLRHERGF